MISTKFNSLLFLLALACCTYQLNGSIILHGDSENPDQTFTFPVGPFVTNIDGSVAYFGALTTGANTYALTKFIINGTTGLAVAPEQVSIDKKPGYNPLYNAAIQNLAFMNKENRLVAVLKDHPQAIFAVDDIIKPENIVMFGIRYLFDATGNQATSAILTIAAESVQFIFAAVLPRATGSTFGDAGSGIALVRRVNMVEKKADPESASNIMEPFFYQLDAEPGIPTDPNLQRAAALSGSTPAIALNAPATLLNNMIDLYYQNIFQVLYIALQVQSGSHASDGARAIVAATIESQNIKDLRQQYKLTYKAIAPDAAFVAGQNTIVGRINGTDLNSIVSCYKVRTMLTSTDLFYLVVLGGYGDAPVTHQTIYTLPLVFLPGDPAHGTLANKNAIPVDHFDKEAPNRLSYRAFEQAATTAGDLFTADDPAVQVGGGALPAGPINTIFMNNDAIFATVSDPAPGYLPGIFYSHALFDKYGRIKSWTPWQRAFGSVNDQIFGGYIYQHDGSCTFLTGTAADQIFTLKRTIWQNNGADAGMANLGKLLSTTLKSNEGGSRGFVECAACSTGLDGISCIIATGVNKILLAQTAYTPGSGVVTPIVGDALAKDPITFTNGTITNNFPVGDTNVIVVEGGALTTIGPVLAAAIGMQGTSGLLFVGGVGGLAVLVDDEGTGWQTPPGLGNQFAGLRAGMAFKSIGNYQFIRKLLVDNGNLYVLCDEQLDRIDLVASDFATGTLVKTTIATATDLNVQSFLDCIIADELALLGTSNGFYRSSPAQNISTDTRISWQEIALPEGLSSILQLYGVTQTSCMHDLIQGTGGNVFVLSTDRGKNRTNVFRFAVAPTDHGVAIDELPDKFIKDHPSYFVEFSDFRNWILPAGDFLFHARDRENREPSALFLAPNALRTGIRFAGNNNTVLYASNEAEHLVPMLRNSASGSLLMANNFGLICNE